MQTDLMPLARFSIRSNVLTLISEQPVEIFTKKITGQKKFSHSASSITKISYIVVIVALLIIPASLPGQASWVTGIKAPPTILNGGTTFNIATDDWPAAMEWLKNKEITVCS